jgi:ligand-binding sensor domain-containing protein
LAHSDPPNFIKALRQYIERQQTFPSGLYASSLDSANWQCVSWQNLRLRTFTISLATGQPQLLLAAKDGVLRPFSNSTGWKFLSDWQITQITDLEKNPFDEQSVYVSTANGIFVLQEKGKSWQPANQGLGCLFVSCVLPDPRQKGRLFAGTENGLYQSLDAGRSWQLLALSGIAVRALLREPETLPGTFWVGTERHGLYGSFDGGRTFAPVSVGEDSVSIYALAGGGTNATIFAGAYRRGLFAASSNEKIWRQQAGSENLGSVLCILPMDDRKTIFVGTHDRGIFVSRDSCATWQPFGLDGAQVRQLMIGEPNWLRP